MVIAGASPLATSIGSGASAAAPWVSSAWLSTGTASGSVTLGGYDYSSRLPAPVQCTHILRCWPLAMQPPRLTPRTLPEGRERTPQRLARIPLPPPLCWVHPHPKSNPSISCRVHNCLVNPVRLPNQMYYPGKIFTYRLDRTTVTVGAQRMLAMSTSPASAGASSWASAAAGS
jgi:hypothetical protein